MAISLTKRAAEEVKKIMEAQSLAPETVLRTVIVGGGCSGMQYTLGFDTKFDPEIDAKYVSDGVPIVAEKKFALFLDGAKIDFLDTPSAERRTMAARPVRRAAQTSGSRRPRKESDSIRIRRGRKASSVTTAAVTAAAGISLRR